MAFLYALPGAVAEGLIWGLMAIGVYISYKILDIADLTVDGSICNPSPEAIHAALYPDESYVAEKYLYFCSKDPDTGELHFSRTLEEHERAVEIYAPLWQMYDAERGM